MDKIRNIPNLINNKDLYIHVKVMDKILDHLGGHKNEHRKRERLRVRTAIATIEKWKAEVEAKYDTIQGRNS